ncbi:ABC transporter substrate-binding protein [Pandoraea apista]|uniref:ABC transporter substrate-binding protein n=1 Tax=Pandoraea apista TaxID=93218 RepID=A0A0B5FE63_9BURK|nr:ABC transporter substrate-binding protein [Pandoraea apista]AJE99061.1 ABC transporter substrate-binding protein [Pandoraea apista]AKH73156.1 ABC transporter substrate-binding protein [Pandoraea apista]AKI61552.1 ABC transporter substrate-binding protein [Pandoraea apista]ALS65382.1 ABC transporter substrate-binding protein [Pandoraea apista]AVF39765.1 ABC transporter substrate-binding protein [Pandoraea apista]
MFHRKIIATLTMAFAASAGVQHAHALTVYTAGPGNLSKKLAAGFEKKTGIKVDVFQATTGKVMARIEAEQANPRADVLISASWDTAQDLEKRGWLAPVQSANAARVPAPFKTPHYVAQGLSALGIVWNAKSGTPEPHDWRDLTKPAYRNLVTMPDPALSGASADLLLGLQARLGGEAWKLFDDLRHNGMVVSGPNAQALNPVLQGAKAAVFGAVDYVAYAAAANGEAVKVIFPTSGTVIAPRPMMILNTSKQQNEARQFIDYVLSEEGQQMVAEAWLIPAREDIAIKRASFKDLRLLPQGDAQSSSASRAEVLARFAKLNGQH